MRTTVTEIVQEFSHMFAMNVGPAMAEGNAVTVISNRNIPHSDAKKTTARRNLPASQRKGVMGAHAGSQMMGTSRAGVMRYEMSYEMRRVYKMLPDFICPDGHPERAAKSNTPTYNSRTPSRPAVPTRSDNDNPIASFSTDDNDADCNDAFLHRCRRG